MRSRIVLFAAATVALAGCGSSTAGSQTAPGAAAVTPSATTAAPATARPAATGTTAPTLPSSPAASTPVPVPGSATPDHLVIVVEENHSFAETAAQPYLSSLEAGGATFVDSHGVAHPSEPNYLALWSGSAHGVTSDRCPVDLGAAPNLGAQLLAAGRTVAGYLEAMPTAGYRGCSAGSYARKHNPLADFAATSDAAHTKPFSAFPTTADGYAGLPSVSLVVPDLDDDMHDGSVAQGDAWLHAHLSGYAGWAQTHNSVLVVTFDEDDDTAGNHILTVFSGQHVKPGRYGERITHDNVLATVEHAYGLAPLTDAAAIDDIWQ